MPAGNPVGVLLPHRWKPPTVQLDLIPNRNGDAKALIQYRSSEKGTMTERPFFGRGISCSRTEGRALDRTSRIGSLSVHRIAMSSNVSDSDEL